MRRVELQSNFQKRLTGAEEPSKSSPQKLGTPSWLPGHQGDIRPPAPASGAKKETGDRHRRSCDLEGSQTGHTKSHLGTFSAS